MNVSVVAFQAESVQNIVGYNAREKKMRDRQSENNWNKCRRGIGTRQNFAKVHHTIHVCDVYRDSKRERERVGVLCTVCRVIDESQWDFGWLLSHSLHRKSSLA